MKAPTRHVLAATVLGLALGAVLVFASHVVYQRNVEQTRETTARKSQQAAYQIDLLIGARLGVGRYLQQLWRDGDLSSQRQFRLHARALLDTYSGIRHIAWLDADGRFTWIEPETDGADLLGRKLRDDPRARETFEEVSNKGVAAFIPPHDFPGGANGFVNLSP
ncbi:MAG: hypothetical protein RLO49_13965, partial [Rhodospirillales bacterium]